MQKKSINERASLVEKCVIKHSLGKISYQTHVLFTGVAAPRGHSVSGLYHVALPG